jgi:hypothetical protein
MVQPRKRPPLRLYRALPCLTFAPLAFLKLQYFCHAGPTEVGGFGIAAAADPLYVEDFVTVDQRVTPTAVRFDDNAVADFFDACVDRGLPVERFGRLWCHTHPGASVAPSLTDEETFARCFGRCDWSVMFILGRTGRTSARLAFRAGPGAELELSAAVDWAAWPACLAAKPGAWEARVDEWQAEYAAHVHPVPEARVPFALLTMHEAGPDWWDEYPWDRELDDICYQTLPEGEDHDRANPKPAS